MNTAITYLCWTVSIDYVSIHLIGRELEGRSLCFVGILWAISLITSIVTDLNRALKKP